VNTKGKATLAVAAAAVLLAGGGYLLHEQSQPPPLPPDGLALYRTLLEEIPEVVSEVPCACCKQTLSWCYEGGCPPT
jgi:hypothetical protein